MSNTTNALILSFLFISSCGSNVGTSPESDSQTPTLTPDSQGVETTTDAGQEESSPDVSDGKVITTITISMNPDTSQVDDAQVSTDGSDVNDAGEVITTITISMNPDTSPQVDAQQETLVDVSGDVVYDITNSSSAVTYKYGVNTWNVSCMFVQTNKFFNDMNNNQLTFVRMPEIGDSTISQCQALTVKIFKSPTDPATLREIIATNCYGFLYDTWITSYMSSCKVV